MTNINRVFVFGTYEEDRDYNPVFIVHSIHNTLENAKKYAQEDCLEDEYSHLVILDEIDSASLSASIVDYFVANKLQPSRTNPHVLERVPVIALILIH